MIKNLKNDYQLRGRAFEHIARTLLRRERKNNFIFDTKQFDSFEEIKTKYRLKITKDLKDIETYFKTNQIKTDLIEFILNNKTDRIIEKINFYEVKTRKHDSKRKYYETCLSNHEFIETMQNKNYECFIISIILFENWTFSFKLHQYNEVLLRIYDSTIKKTIGFTKNNKLIKKT
ncbi:hypothetical protein K9L97_02775 [Candidatus Woesearchaeota archaeon]|nr:hypothetical protein [Candidatus Woesearchaeota archaeon]